VSQEIDDRIRSVVRAIAEASPEPPPVPAGQLTSTATNRNVRRKGALVSAGLAFVGVLAVVGVMLFLRGQGTEVISTTTPPAEATIALIPVLHQVYEYRQSAELSTTCGEGQAVESEGFDTLTIEVWADLENRRFRQQVTYPDGSTHDVIALGHPSLPSSSYARGESKLKRATCAGGTGGNDPGFLLFNPTENLGVLLFNSPFEEPGAMGYAELGTLIAGVDTDSQGRPATLYRETIEGTTGNGSGAEHAIKQATEWYVDQKSGDLLEVAFNQTIEGIAAVGQTTTLVTEEEVRVENSLFDTTGYTLVWEESDYSEGAGVEAEPVEPSTALGPEWIWPETPDPVGPIEVATRFAAEVLGWTQATAVADPEAAADGPQVVTINDESLGRSLMFFVFPIGSEGWASNQIGNEGVGLGVGAEASVKAIITPVEGAISAEILVGTADNTLAWRVDLAPKTTDITLPGVAYDDIRTVLVVFSDGAGQVVSAAGGHFYP